MLMAQSDTSNFPR